MYILRFHKNINKDYKKIGHPYSVRIREHIMIKLSSRPLAYGEALQGQLKGFFRLRSGNYRVIYTILENNEVYVVMIAHRRAIYEDILKRLGLSS